MTQQEEYERFWQPLLSHYVQGKTALPPFLGLSLIQYQHLIEQVNDLSAENYLTYAEHHAPAMMLRQELLGLRQSEHQELLNLLSNALNLSSHFGHDMVTVIANACMGGQHLWRDLGMPDRPRLTELFAYYFPILHANNSRNMRWKRFLYKQLCEGGGDYLCRAPSCDQCSSFDECFIS
jgi:nitrogen fixation protein NifQ